MRGALLVRANLSQARMRGVDLVGAALNEATLHQTSLIKADLSYSVLRKADFLGAVLSQANLSGTQLDGCNFEGAICGSTIFGDVDLSGALGLETIVHVTASTVGIDTLFRSKGNIPEAFLLRCGVPKPLIEYLPSIMGAMEPIQFYSCFISYSTKNQDFAERLHSKMRDMGLRVWFAPEDVQGGKKLHEQIDEAIRVYDKLLLVLSPESMNSEWVRTEIRKARKAEIKEGKRKLFPIRLVDFNKIREWECFDADSGKDLGVEIREFFIPDFSNWKGHDSFEAAFARLLKDLKAEESIGSKHD